eukprot:TRINITY_DN7654_c0_g2_i3.p3 TRINITY_DN7654_c0_g2~~TRINITY_DN7654_c0_g2_i3.p3  ORF type:complete len:114 (+),score=4.69 TRINITY_DN7654_c0_g2_i3:237-578(+)
MAAAAPAPVCGFSVGPGQLLEHSSFHLPFHVGIPQPQIGIPVAPSFAPGGPGRGEDAMAAAAPAPVCGFSVGPGQLLEHSSFHLPFHVGLPQPQIGIPVAPPMHLAVPAKVRM